MKRRSIRFEDDSLEQFYDWSLQDKSTFSRLYRILEELKRNPFEGIGKPEPLKGNLKGHWSRRIDQEHRLVYYVEDEAVTIVSCRGHYEKT